MSDGKVIGIISIKGGVGKTTTVANLGAVLADEFMKRVLIVDANFSAPNLGLHLGIVQPEVTMHDVLADKAPIRQAVLAHQCGFDVLPSSLIPKKINPYKLKNRLESLRSEYDYILIDSSPTLNEEILSTMIASDALLVVTTPDYPTLSTTMHAIQVAKRKKTPIIGLIINKIRNKSFELDVEDIQNSTGVPVLAVLPDDINVLESLSNTLPVALKAPRGKATIEFKKLGAALVGEQYADPRLFKRMKQVVRGYSVPELNRQQLAESIKK